MNTIRIGIIGTGRFATVLCKLFERDKTVSILQSSRSKPIDNKRIFSFSDVVNCDLVIPAVPISTLEKVLKECVIELQPNNTPLFISVCSVMEKPEKLMLKHLGDRVDILISHPMFGPDSTKQGTEFQNLPFVWNPVRISDKRRLNRLKQFLLKQKLQVMPLSSSQHDSTMAKTQAVSFLFGQIGMDLKLKPTPLDTIGFTHILKNQTIVEHDSTQLFLDIFRHNIHAKNTLKRVQQKITKVIQEMERKDHA